MVKEFKREFDSLKQIFEFVDEFIVARRISEAHRYPITFVIEELFTNMVKYNSHGEREIVLRLEDTAKQILIEIVDYTDQPFDLSKHRGVDVALPLEDRNPGGLGIYLTKKMMDEIHYSFKNGESRTTLIKYLEKKHV